MKGWRPHNWENPLIAKIKEVSSKLIRPMALVSWKEMAIQPKIHYEAGADAMLEALKDRVGSRRNKGNSGWFVFIPDEEAKE